MTKELKQTLKAELHNKQRLYAQILKENSGSEYLAKLSREIGELNVRIHVRKY